MISSGIESNLKKWYHYLLGEGSSDDPFTNGNQGGKNQNEVKVVSGVSSFIYTPTPVPLHTHLKHKCTFTFSFVACDFTF